MSILFYLLMLMMALLLSWFKRFLVPSPKDGVKVANPLPDSGHNIPTMVIAVIYDTLIHTRNTSMSLFRLLNYYSNKYSKEGIISGNFYPITPCFVLISSPKAFQDILTDKDNIDKNSTYKIIEPFLGKRNIMLSGGNEWKQDRKIINQSFNYSNILSMTVTIEGEVDNFIKKVSSSNLFIGDMRTPLEQLVTRVLLKSIIGKVANSKESIEGINGYVDSQAVVCKSLLTQSFPLFYYFPFLYYYTFGLRVLFAKNRARSFIESCVRDRLHKMMVGDDCGDDCDEGVGDGDDGNHNNIEDHSLADSLVRAHINDPIMMPQKVIVDQVITIIFAGGKATSLTLNSILFLLASHPDKQKILQQELLEYEKEATNDGHDLYDVNNLSKLTYLTAVIKEGQRMYPVSSVIGRKVSKEFTCNGYIIPVGHEVAFDMFSLNRHPESFPYKPNEFIPERFIPGNESFDDHRHPFSTVPFAHGLRKCIGEKIGMNILRIFLTKILTRFQLTTSQTMDTISIAQDFMVYIDTPIDISFKPIDTK